MTAYVIITLAELCISVVGLELAFSEAPKRMKSTITAFFLLTVFFDNLLAGFMSEVYPSMNPGHYFGGLTIMMVVVAVAFRIVGRRFKMSVVSTELNAA